MPIQPLYLYSLKKNVFITIINGRAVGYSRHYWLGTITALFNIAQIIELLYGFVFSDKLSIPFHISEMLFIHWPTNANLLIILSSVFYATWITSKSYHLKVVALIAVFFSFSRWLFTRPVIEVFVFCSYIEYVMLSCPNNMASDKPPGKGTKTSYFEFVAERERRKKNLKIVIKICRR